MAPCGTVTVSIAVSATVIGVVRVKVTGTVQVLTGLAADAVQVSLPIVKLPAGAMATVIPLTNCVVTMLKVSDCVCDAPVVMLYCANPPAGVNDIGAI